MNYDKFPEVFSTGFGSGKLQECAGADRLTLQAVRTVTDRRAVS